MAFTATKPNEKQIKAVGSADFETLHFTTAFVVELNHQNWARAPLPMLILSAILKLWILIIASGI